MTKLVTQITKQNLIDQYRQNTNHIIQIEDKFDTFRLYNDKSTNPYFKIDSQYIRKCYIHLRLDKALNYSMNTHNLCNECNIQKSTKHIILYCKKYEKARKELTAKLINIYPFFENMSPDNKFKLIMNLQIKSKHAISIICLFIKQICNVLNIY